MGGMFSSKGKSGKGEVHQAQDQTWAALAGFEKPDDLLDRLMGNSLRSLGGVRPEQLLGEGQQALSGLYQAMPWAQSLLTDPNSQLAFGLSSPGILDNLVARSQEASSAQSRAAAQEAGNVMPRGGANARAISDIYSSGASNAVNAETGLRAEAAQQDLQNRLNVFGGITGAMNPITSSMSGALSPLMDALQMMFASSEAKGSIRTGLADKYFQRSQDIMSSRNQFQHDAISTWGDPEKIGSFISSMFGS